MAEGLTAIQVDELLRRLAQIEAFGRSTITDVHDGAGAGDAIYTERAGAFARGQAEGYNHAAAMLRQIRDES